jgi:hypothetical protein
MGRTYTKQQLAAMTEAEQLNLFRKMATQYATEHKCRWSEACLAIKKLYPEARAAFCAPPPIEA